jgi:hypothetical protein
VAREGLDLFTPEDRHETYKALGIKVIAHPGGSIELTGRVFVDVHNDNSGMIPFERIESLHSPLRFRVSLGDDEAPELEVVR